MIMRDRSRDFGIILAWRSTSHLPRALILCAILLGGCRSCLLPNRQDFASSQTPYLTLRLAATTGSLCADAPERNLVQAEADFAAARLWERRHREECVDLYFRAAMRTWPLLELGATQSACTADYHAALLVYQESLLHLITTGCRFGRLDPRGRLIISEQSGRRTIPIAYYGFAWKPDEFCQVLAADEFSSRDIAHHYHTEGLGVALVMVRHAQCKESFYRSRQPFPVTAVLRPARPLGRSIESGVTVPETPDAGASLEFYNPCLFDSVRVGCAAVLLNRDLTAPFAYLLEDTPRKYLEGFLDPGETDVKPKLIFMEPYQRGKIPVVCVHGLGSDPMTWIDAINQFRTQSDLYQQYQFWYFRYPTGSDLLESAAALREILWLVREIHDPRHEDLSLERMVLIGHSMGGLVAQLQVTYSHDILWRQAARQPLESVRTGPAMRERLRRNFFFDPCPLVKRVVFMGTPHRGSSMARRLAGRVASSLVRLPEEEQAEYRQLMDDNRDIFYEYLWDSRPTTIDLLEPSNPLLEAMSRMPFNPCVRLHSVIGTGQRTWNGELSDGVVSVSSARQAGVCSELFVPVRHTQVNKCDTSVAELIRLLREHAQDGPARLNARILESFSRSRTPDGAVSTAQKFPPSRPEVPAP